MNRLIAYQWPGNVRQLKSTIRRAVLMADEEIAEKHLDLSDIPQQEMADTPPEQDETSWEGRPLREIIKQNTSILEKKILTNVLQQVGGNKAKAARRLKNRL